METKPFDELQPDPTNPRYMRDDQGKALKASLFKYGDLSGIVKNLPTGHMIGGNQRTKIFMETEGEKRVVIVQRLDAPNRQGTIANGYVELGGELYAYREVVWDRGMELAARQAANHMGGQDNEDLLSQDVFEMSQMENGDDLLGETGLSSRKISNLLANVGVGEGDPPDDDTRTDDDTKKDKLTFAITKDQREIIEQALDHVIENRELQAAESASINGSALYVLCKDYLKASDALQPTAGPEPVSLDS